MYGWMWLASTRKLVRDDKDNPSAIYGQGMEQKRMWVSAARTSFVFLPRKPIILILQATV